MYPNELNEVQQIIAAINSKRHKTKTSLEKTMPSRKLYSPLSLNRAFKREFGKRGWVNRRVKCEYPDQYYVPGYTTLASSAGAFREMDFVKNRLGG